MLQWLHFRLWRAIRTVTCRSSSFVQVIPVSRNLRFVVIGLGILGAIGYLVFSGIRAEGVRYARINELATDPGASPSTVKVTGKVQEETLEYSPDAPLLEFAVSGPKTDHSVRVVYEGIKPDALRETGHVILKGRYDPDENRLEAYSLLAKCPSRYKSEYESYDEKTSGDTAASY